MLKRLNVGQVNNKYSINRIEVNKMIKKYIPTGNEMIAIPTIDESDASINSINFLHMGFKGLIEICGGATNDNAFLKPIIKFEKEEKKINMIGWDRINYWIPTYKAECEDVLVGGTILAPIGERGFIYYLKFSNISSEIKSFSVGIKGCWLKTLHTINESKEVTGEKHIYKSGWNDSFVCDLRNSTSLFSFAPIFEEKMDVENFEKKADEIKYEILKEIQLKPGDSKELVFYFGVGFEEVGSTTSAKEMMRKGYTKVLSDTMNWLLQRQKKINNLELDKLFNTNLFFNFFYASGMTLDTEEFVLVTSRSPRYYVSAAYWDRDSLLWSFPSILIVDTSFARNMLEYVFTRQIKNVGVHSRYIDGTVLEPGFELDELCAPVIALYNYLKHSGDRDILNETFIIKGIDKILSIINTKKHENTDLYETFLQPTDDMIVYQYLTYDNILVWKSLVYIAEMFEDNKGKEFCNKLLEMAKRIENAIWNNCVIEHEGKKIFAWSIDMKSRSNIYDEPPGSLQLLAFYGFCSFENDVYKNTVETIRRQDYAFSFYGCNIPEIGCEHAPHPWILSIANSLLCGRKNEFLKMLPFLKMDNGIACESVNEMTGECTTGEAFATCAGFLAYSLYHAFYKENQD